jgi:hypothetical protein
VTVAMHWFCKYATTIETFLRGQGRGVILKTIGATRQMRIELWNVKELTKGAEEFPSLSFFDKKHVVKTLQGNNHCGELLPRRDY